MKLLICRGIRRAAFKERTGADIGIEDEIEGDQEDQEEEEDEEDQEEEEDEEDDDTDFYEDEDDDDDVDDTEAEDENQEDIMDYSDLRNDWNQNDLQGIIIGSTNNTDIQSVD